MTLTKLQAEYIARSERYYGIRFAGAQTFARAGGLSLEFINAVNDERRRLCAERADADHAMLAALGMTGGAL